MEFLANEPLKDSLLGQMSVFILLDALLWAGYVYIIQYFKNLTREKLVPVIEDVDKNPQTRIKYPKLFRQFFEGLRIEWNSGFGLNIYIRSSLVSILLIFSIYQTMKDSINGLLAGVFFLHSIDAIISLYLSMVAIGVVAIPVYIVYLTILTVPVIFVYLFIAVRFLPLEINAFHEMGGTGQFGKIIINCIYLISFAIGMIPIFSIIGKLDLTSFHIPIPEGNIGNATAFIKGEVVKSVNTIPIESFSRYIGFIELFLIFIMLAFLVIAALHFRIKHHKKEVLSKLEQIISETNITRPENKENNLYFLSLYEKVSAMNGR